MNIGVVGLGRMGGAIVSRLVKGGHHVIGYDPSEKTRVQIELLGATTVSSLTALAKQVRTIWLMIPAGDLIDEVIDELKPDLRAGDIIIDGGNSFFEHSINRHNDLAAIQVGYLDCGTSGGLAGETIGFSLMLGGDEAVYNKIMPLLTSVATPNGFAYMGPPGSGHYVKMVHNGIEYALLQSYAEGFHLLKEGHYPHLDLAKIANIWSHGSIIRSWILELTKNILSRDQELTNISGEIGENLTGRWTLDEAKKQDVPVNLIEEALAIRTISRQTGGNYGTKLVALMRHEFGGHHLAKINEEKP